MSKKGQKTYKEKLFAWLLMFSMIFQGAGIMPLIAYADVTVDVSNSGVTTHYAVASSTDNIAISYTLPEGTPTTTPTLDTLAGILSIINTSLVSAKASTTCTGTGSATANASATGSVALNDGVSVVAKAIASASVNCTPSTETVPPPVTIVAQKIACDDVSMLPKWGNGGPDIMSSTAEDYVASHSGCHFVPDWKFQWGFGDNTANTKKGVQDLSGSFVGEADGSKGQGTNTELAYDGWRTFGPTDGNGLTRVEIPALEGATSLWVREVLQNGYIPFTFDSAHPSNDNPNSAEMYCSNDVLNYDNYDRITGPTPGAKYYCVAFNAKKKDIGNQCVVPVETPADPAIPKISVSVGTEKSLQKILIESGYTLNVLNDQTNIDHWNLAQSNPAMIEVKVLGKYAGNSEVFGYYTGSATSSFTPVFRYGVHTAFPSTLSLGQGETKTFIVPTGASFGFGIDTQKADLTRALFATAQSLNVDLMKHALVYHPSADEYIIAFEDLAKGVTDSDYNDLVISLRVQDCNTPPPPRAVCALDVVSDATNHIDVIGSSIYATSTYNMNPRWTAHIPGATWIWKTFFVEHPTQNESTTFAKEFVLSGVVASSTLVVAADNSYTVSINGTAVGADNTEFNYFEEGKDSYDVASFLHSGSNTISFTVKNWALAGSSAQLNPAGLLYKLHVGLTGEGCDVPPPPPPPVNNPPVITIVGDNPMTMTVGTMFVDPGATANDPEDGDITSSIIKSGSVSTSTVGTYTITYNVKDSQGLAAPTKTRTVIVASQCSDGKDNDGDGKIDYPADTGCDSPNDNSENNKPIITVLGANPLDITIGTVFTDPGATAFDQEDGTITPQIIATNNVNTSATGTYAVIYNVKDSQGLAGDTKTRVVNVNPIVTQCSDGKDNDGDGKIDYPADTGCDNPNDNDENNKPVITVIGDNPLIVHIGTLFVDPGATAFDQEDGTITPQIIATGTVDMLNVGTYTIFYNVKDSKGLAAVEKTREVKVISSCSDGKDNDGDGKIDYPADTGCENPNDDSENQAPTLTLLGDVIMNIFMGSTFTDPGATATDTEDGDLTPKIVKGGAVNTSTLGTYFLTYGVTDSGGLSAPTTTRTVNVVPEGCTANCGGGGGTDNARPIITLKGANPLVVTQGTTFVDPGATAFDSEDGDLTAKIVNGGTVDTSKLGDYLLTYDVSDSKGLPAAQAKRTVTVVPGGGGGGSGPITLIINNEKLTVTGTTTVLVTWNTNQPATSRIVYGLDAHATLADAPMYGYQLTTATDTALVTSHSVVIQSIPSAIATYFRPVSTDGVRIATGIELTRTPITEAPAECFYLKEYMHLGANNNPAEVTKLQTFLRDYEGFTDLRVTGTFDLTTDQAVRSFQDKYAADVLTPWNLSGNTGYVYYTTEKKINEIYCKREFPLNATQLAEIVTFRELINRINAQGAGALPTLPLVGVNKPAGETTGGIVAGASTENGGAIASGVSTVREPSGTEKRGGLALAQLLATAPSVGNQLSGTDTNDLTGTTNINANGAVIATSTKHGLAAVIESMSDKMNISNGTLYFLFLFVILTLIFSTIYLRTRNEVAEEIK